MKKYNIKIITANKGSISVDIGDEIVDTRNTRFEVVDINYNSRAVVFSNNGSNYTLTFVTAACGSYFKILK